MASTIISSLPLPSVCEDADEDEHPLHEEAADEALEEAEEDAAALEKSEASEGRPVEELEAEENRINAAAEGQQRVLVTLAWCGLLRY